jgi:hypothetical protein
VGVAVGDGVAVEIGRAVSVAGTRGEGVAAALHAVNAKVTKSSNPFFIPSSFRK